jgi:hypothetical protein
MVRRSTIAASSAERYRSSVSGIHSRPITDASYCTHSP